LRGGGGDEEVQGRVSPKEEGPNGGDKEGVRADPVPRPVHGDLGGVSGGREGQRPQGARSCIGQLDPAEVRPGLVRVVGD